MPPFVWLEVITYGLAFWLGCYLISRDSRRPTLLAAGLGLVAYAGALAVAGLGQHTALPWSRWPAVSLAWLAAILWAGAIGLGLRHRLKGGRARLGRALTILLLVSLASGLIALTLGWGSPNWVMLAIGVDLGLLGLVIAGLDALDLGEALGPHMLRSFDAALIAALLFGGQVGLAMLLSTGLTAPMFTLLYASVASAIGLAVFAAPAQGLLDGLAFSTFPRLRATRTDLRAVQEALPRTAGLDLASLDDETFTRLVRRALSQMGDLPRLAASPLTNLPQVEIRLAARHVPLDNPLERAAELKAVLAESIQRLKPRGKGDFGMTDEWRHYNALYFPYVVGLKPYSRRAVHEGLAPDHVAALDWLQTYVPERTLYNWQNAATRLVAQDLRSE